MKLLEVIHKPDRTVLLRYEGDMEGVYRPFRSAIDALLARVGDEFGLPRSQSGISLQMGINHASISRCRHGHYSLRQEWIMRMHDYSGIPIEELRRIGNLEPLAERCLRRRVE